MEDRADDENPASQPRLDFAATLASIARCMPSSMSTPPSNRRAARPADQFGKRLDREI